MWVRGENSGNVDSGLKVVFYKGSQKEFGKVTVKKTLPGGVTKIVGPRWVRGGGATVKIRTWNPDTEVWDLRIKFDQNEYGDAWGTGDCPENRFGEPTWENPRYTTR